MTPRKHFVTRLALVATMVVLSVVGSVAGAWAQTQPAPQTLPYSQDFSGLAWTSTTYPAGWQGWQISTTPGATFSTVGPTGDRALVASRDASVTNGDVDNYNGKIGFLNNGSLDLTLGLVINTSDKSGITVSYDIMTIRNAQDGTNSRQNEVTLQYRAGIAGPWTTLTGVEYTNLTGAINNQTGAVTTPQNLQTKSIVLPAACEGHPVLQLRWASRQVSGTGSRPSFAVDNVSVSASGTLPALPDLIARWALDGNIDDASGNSLASGTTAGSPTYVTGLEGTQALNLNGTNQYAAVPHDYRLNATNAITLAAWIRPGKTGTQALITKSINGTAATGVNGYELSLATTGFPFVRFNQATSGDTYRLNATTVNTSNGTNWMHLAATYDGATARIYVNGVLNASAAMVVPIATNSVPVGIGSQFDGTGSRFFQGAMDDARVYSRALSAAEIEALASHTLAVTATNGTVANSPDQPSYLHNSSVSLTASPSAGYHFVNWTGDTAATANPLPVLMIRNKSVTANFALNTYTLTYNATAGGSIVGTSPQTVNHGADGALVTATPNAGYHFVSWSDAYPTAARTDLGVTADITVTATFAPDTYTLTYNAGAGGTIVGTNPQTVNHGADGTLVTATPNVGYHFVSWSDAYPTAARTDLAVTGDITATATFAINTYTLTYGAGAGGSIVGTSPQIVNHGADGALVTATPNAGFHFVAWSDAYPTAARTDLNVTADLSVSASFAPDAPTNTSTVSLGAAPGLITLTTPVRTIPVTISRTDVTPMMAFSVVFSVSSPLALNGGLSGIHQGAYLSDANPVTSFNVIDKGVDGFGNHSYQADGTTLGAPCGSSAASGTLFTIDLSSAAPNGSGTVTITSLKLRDCGNADLSSVIGTTSSVTVDQSAPTVHLDIPNTAVTWRVGATETIEWTASDAEGLTTIDLAYSTDGGATYPNAIATVPATQSTYAWTIPATPSTQVRVRATAHDTNGNTAADASDVDFTIAYYTLTYTAGANGSITGTSPQSVALGGNGTAVTAVPALGYHFVSWSDGVLTASRTDLNVTADISVTATFAINTYTLTYTAGANGSITGSSPQTVNYGANGTAVTAVADLGYHFVSWSDGVLTASRTDLNVTADITVTATFAINTYTLTYTAGPNGSISGTTPQTVAQGGNGTPVTAVPDVGYHFVSWSDGVLTAGRTDLNVTADITVTATFAANPAVPAITHLTATQNRTGNPAGATTGITLSWDATPNTVEVWRLGFGSYPEYDDAGGAIPTASASYPPGGAWVKTTVTAPGGVDYVTTRDFYYYVAYQQDGYGTWSPAVLTTGTLNYHLGDVSDGITAGAGNNLVFTGDVSLLGAHYGLVGGGVAAYAYLDVGPTTTMFIDGRPTTDNEIGFEDLVIFAINYNAVSAPSSKATPATSGAANELVLEAPQHVEAGAAVSARLTMSGAGNLVALSTKLSWDPAVVQPVGHAAGEWLTAQQGVAFSATPGTVDAAVMQSQGMSGSGVMATLTFRVLSAGDPKIRIVSTDGRDASNQKVAVANSLLPQAPLVTQLAPSKPNPFRQSATLSFSLAKGGPVEMHLYSVDGRRVRTLVNGVRGAGEYSLVWDGRDDNGTPLAAGVYYLRLSTPQGRFTRTMTYLK